MHQSVNGGFPMVGKAVDTKEKVGTGWKAAFSIEDSCAYIDVSRPTLYRLLDQGVLPSLHIGRRRLILRRDLDKFLQERLEAEGHAVGDD
jgi:excisionase family DNA binding protein